MKILHVIRSVNPAGGGPIEGVRQLGRALTNEGHNVEVASLDSPDAPFLGHLGLPVHALGPARMSYSYSPRLIPWLRENRSRYDAVVVDGIWQFHSFATWRALRNSSTPYAVFTHGMLDPWFKKHYPLKHLKKWLYWPWAEYRVLRDAQAVLFTCEEERLLARSSFWLYRCNEVVVNYGTALPDGDADAERIEFFSRYPELRGKRLALFMGRIHYKKGCNLLIEAFAREMKDHPEWQLVIAGPDSTGWRRDLELQARELGMAARITWTGMLSGALKWGALHAAEVFILPSHQENFGVAVAEALACGLPVLISKKVNIWREVEESGAGRVDADDLEGTRRLLGGWIESSSATRLETARLARRCFDAHFEIGGTARRLLTVLNQIVDSREMVCATGIQGISTG